MTLDTIKRCGRCKSLRQAAAIHFHRHQRAKDGFASWCKACVLSYMKSRGPRPASKQYRVAIKMAAFRAYSGEHPSCVCCGESMLEFLGLDHINGNGTTHRADMRKEGMTTYLWLRLHNYPDGFQVMCHNCNMAKGFYGVCPHQAMAKL